MSSLLRPLALLCSCLLLLLTSCEKTAEPQYPDQPTGVDGCMKVLQTYTWKFQSRTVNSVNELTECEQLERYQFLEGGLVRVCMAPHTTRCPAYDAACAASTPTMTWAVSSDCGMMIYDGTTAQLAMSYQPPRATITFQKGSEVEKWILTTVE